REFRYMVRGSGGEWARSSISWPQHFGGHLPVRVDNDMQLHLLYVAIEGLEGRVVPRAGELRYAVGRPGGNWRHSMVVPLQDYGARLVVSPSGEPHILYHERGAITYAQRSGCLPND
ncbi:MAG: hypothetical protein AAGF12_29730, partial [Myxococcota bacterium]